MTTLIKSKPEIFYPSSDGEPVAETYDHFYAIMITLEILRQYLTGTQATVLGNQFLYYSQGFPRLRVAPDVMVIFNVQPGGRENYKIWEEGEVPQVIFEMTSPSTREQDLSYKKTLYEQLGVQEYWLFDPRGEWIENKLIGYRLQRENYQLITDNFSEPLQLNLKVKDKLIAFYRKDNGEKLLTPDELKLAKTAAEIKAQEAEIKAQEAEIKAQEAEIKAQEAEDLLARYRERFGELS
jgi:Uma2 family endonuclease